MKTKRSALIDVGIFMTVGLVLALVSVFFVGREKSLFEKRYALVASFKEISGLRMGAIVQLAGLNVGYVDGVRFSKEGSGDHLDVILKIGKTYQDRIRKDSKASIQTQGLLGDKYILITTGSGNMPPLVNGNTIATEEGGSFAALAETGRKTLDEIQETAKTFRSAVKELKLDDKDREHIKKILAHLDETSASFSIIMEKVKNGEGTVGALLMDPSIYFDMRALMGHANRNKLLKNMIRATIEEQEKATTKPVR